jgi:crossover junction endodeoxyribonuclease RuvC
MTILGLDPGIGRTGFAVLDTAHDNLVVRCGCLTTPQDSLGDRLHTLGTDLEHLIESTHPHQAVVEEVFFGKNEKTAMLTAQARGTLLYVLRLHRIPITSLTPLQIKSQLTGYGRADKKQVQAVVTRRLGLATPPQPDDAADALAAALCLADRQQHSPAAHLHNKGAYDSLGEL